MALRPDGMGIARSIDHRALNTGIDAHQQGEVESVSEDRRREAGLINPYADQGGRRGHSHVVAAGVVLAGVAGLAVLGAGTASAETGSDDLSFLDPASGPLDFGFTSAPDDLFTPSTSDPGLSSSSFDPSASFSVADVNIFPTISEPILDLAPSSDARRLDPEELAPPTPAPDLVLSAATSGPVSEPAAPHAASGEPEGVSAAAGSAVEPAVDGLAAVGPADQLSGASVGFTEGSSGLEEALAPVTNVAPDGSASVFSSDADLSIAEGVTLASAAESTSDVGAPRGLADGPQADVAPLDAESIDEVDLRDPVFGPPVLSPEIDRLIDAAGSPRQDQQAPSLDDELYVVASAPGSDGPDGPGGPGGPGTSGPSDVLVSTTEKAPAATDADAPPLVLTIRSGPSGDTEDGMPDEVWRDILADFGSTSSAPTPDGAAGASETAGSPDPGSPLGEQGGSGPEDVDAPAAGTPDEVRLAQARANREQADSALAAAEAAVSRSKDSSLIWNTYNALLGGTFGVIAGAGGIPGTWSANERVWADLNRSAVSTLVNIEEGPGANVRVQDGQTAREFIQQRRNAGVSPVDIAEELQRLPPDRYNELVLSDGEQARRDILAMETSRNEMAASLERARSRNTTDRARTGQNIELTEGDIARTEASRDRDSQGLTRNQRNLDLATGSLERTTEQARVDAERQWVEKVRASAQNPYDPRQILNGPKVDGRPLVLYNPAEKRFLSSPEEIAEATLKLQTELANPALRQITRQEAIDAATDYLRKNPEPQRGTNNVGPQSSVPDSEQQSAGNPMLPFAATALLGSMALGRQQPGTEDDGTAEDPSRRPVAGASPPSDETDPADRVLSVDNDVRLTAFDAATAGAGSDVGSPGQVPAEAGAGSPSTGGASGGGVPPGGGGPPGGSSGQEPDEPEDEATRLEQEAADIQARAATLRQSARKTGIMSVAMPMVTGFAVAAGGTNLGMSLFLNNRVDQLNDNNARPVLAEIQADPAARRVPLSPGNPTSAGDYIASRLAAGDRPSAIYQKIVESSNYPQIVPLQQPEVRQRTQELRREMTTLQQEQVEQERIAKEIAKGQDTALQQRRQLAETSRRIAELGERAGQVGQQSVSTAEQADVQSRENQLDTARRTWTNAINGNYQGANGISPRVDDLPYAAYDRARGEYLSPEEARKVNVELNKKKGSSNPAWSGLSDAEIGRRVQDAQEKFLEQNPSLRPRSSAQPQSAVPSGSPSGVPVSSEPGVGPVGGQVVGALPGGVTADGAPTPTGAAGGRSSGGWRVIPEIPGPVSLPEALDQMIAGGDPRVGVASPAIAQILAGARPDQVDPRLFDPNSPEQEVARVPLQLPGYPGQTDDELDRILNPNGPAGARFGFPLGPEEIPDSTVENGASAALPEPVVQPGSTRRGTDGQVQTLVGQQVLIGDNARGTTPGQVTYFQADDGTTEAVVKSPRRTKSDGTEIVWIPNLGTTVASNPGAKQVTSVQRVSSAEFAPGTTVQAIEIRTGEYTQQLAGSGAGGDAGSVTYSPVAGNPRLQDVVVKPSKTEVVNADGSRTITYSAPIPESRQLNQSGAAERFRVAVGTPMREAKQSVFVPAPVLVPDPVAVESQDGVSLGSVGVGAGGSGSVPQAAAQGANAWAQFGAAVSAFVNGPVTVRPLNGDPVTTAGMTEFEASFANGDRAVYDAGSGQKVSGRGPASLPSYQRPVPPAMLLLGVPGAVRRLPAGTGPLVPVAP